MHGDGVGDRLAVVVVEWDVGGACGAELAGAWGEGDVRLFGCRACEDEGGGEKARVLHRIAACTHAVAAHAS